MNPGSHILEIRQMIEELTDEHPIGRDESAIVYIDLMDELSKLEHYYNRIGLLDKEQE